MKLKTNRNEACESQDKAPRKGVKADDCDEYQNQSIDYNDLSVAKGKAYERQSKATSQRGSRGPSQDDSEPIQKWDKSSGNYSAYSDQSKWGSDNNSNPSLGFKLSGQQAGYLGHFNNEKYLKQGHNDGPNMNMMGVGYSPNGDVAMRNSHSPSQSALIKKGPDEEPVTRRNLEGKEFSKKKALYKDIQKNPPKMTGKVRETNPFTSKRNKADDGNSSGGTSGY